MTFGEKIKEARKLKGFSQRELGNMVGSSPVSVCDWEKDRNKLEIDTLELLCQVLEISPNYILEAKTYPECNEEINMLNASPKFPNKIQILLDKAKKLNDVGLDRLIEQADFYLEKEIYRIGDKKREQA